MLAGTAQAQLESTLNDAYIPASSIKKVYSTEVEKSAIIHYDNQVKLTCCKWQHNLKKRIIDYMLNDYKYYLNETYDFEKSTWVGIGLAIWTIGGVLGFLYETIFYWANSGFQTFYWTSSTFGPWMGTYSIASLLIFLILYCYRKKPWVVILVSAVGCSLIQLLAGLCMYYFFDGKRIWNYNLESLNYGNLGGFICLRSVIVYAILSIFIMYIFVPILFEMACKMQYSSFVKLWFIIGFICLADIAYNDIITAMVPGLPTAEGAYSRIGFNFRRM